MSETERKRPTSVRSLMCGGTDRDAVLAVMERRLPPGGLAEERVRERFSLSRATCRLLDSRILEAAASSLEQDVGTSLAGWLADYHNVRDAAARTLADQEQEIVVLLYEPPPFRCKQDVQVAVYVGDDRVATFTFRLDVELKLGTVSLAVRHAAIEAIVCEVCCASASVTLDGCPKPLWKPDPVSLPDVRIDVTPPCHVPFVQQSVTVPEPRPVPERPPVPVVRSSSRPDPGPGQL